MKALKTKDIVRELNAIVVGSPTKSGFVYSSFSTSKYLKVTGGATVSASALTSFEVCCKVTTPSSWTSAGRILNPTNGADSTTAPYIQVRTGDAVLYWYNGSTYEGFGALGSPASNTTYWFKWVYDGSTVKSYWSTNGKDFTLNAEKTPTYKLFFNSNEFSIGCRSNDSAAVCVWNGSIDLENLYINVNGSPWLRGVKDVVVDKYLAIKTKKTVKKPNVTLIAITPSDEFVLSGFSASKYAVVTDSFAVGSNTWEIGLKFRTGSDVTTLQTVCGHTGSTNYDPIVFEIYKNAFSVNFCSGTSTSIIAGLTGSSIVTANTTYYVKVAFNGSAYTISYSLDGKTYTEYASYSSTKTIYTSNLVLGRQQGDASEYPFLGSIDLKGCYININGERWWNGVKDVQVDKYLVAR